MVDLREIEKNLINQIVEKKLIKNNDKLVVAVSGGPDSIALINLLINLKGYICDTYDIKYTMCIAHFNHKIRKESEEEKKYVMDFASKNSILFEYKEEDIIKLSKTTKTTVEECARNERYKFFYETLEKTGSNKIVVAHNKNDNVETILLNILRGTGLKGLTGMEYEFKNIIRPMLNITKEEVLNYCEEENLKPCIDETNFSDIYKRNKVRLKLLPYLKQEYNENIENCIMRMSAILKEEEDFIQKYTKKVVEKMVKKVYNTKSQSKIEFFYADLLKEHAAIIKRSIRYLIEMLLGNVDGIEQIHILDMIKLLEKNTKGKKYIIGNKFTLEIISKSNAVIYTN